MTIIKPLGLTNPQHPGFPWQDLPHNISKNYYLSRGIEKIPSRDEKYFIRNIDNCQKCSENCINGRALSLHCDLDPVG